MGIFLCNTGFVISIVKHTFPHPPPKIETHLKKCYVISLQEKLQYLYVKNYVT